MKIWNRNRICTVLTDPDSAGPKHTDPMDQDSAPDPKHCKKEELPYHWAPVLENALPSARKAQPSRVKYKKNLIAEEQDPHLKVAGGTPLGVRSHFEDGRVSVSADYL